MISRRLQNKKAKGFGLGFKVGCCAIGNIMEVERSWETIVQKEPSVIGFNCEKLEFIDSSAIGTLVKFFNSSVKNNIEMYVFGLKSELVKIFDTTKINRVMSVIEKSEFEDRFLNN